MKVLFYLTKPHLLWPSNFRIMVSMKIFGGATCPLLTGILKAPRVQSLNPAAQLNVFLYPMVARFWIMYIFFFFNKSRPERACFFVHTPTHTRSQESQDADNIIRTCLQNVKMWGRKKSNHTKHAPLQLFPSKYRPCFHRPRGFSRGNWDTLLHLVSQRGREGEIEPWVSVPYDFNVWSLPGRYI